MQTRRGFSLLELLVAVTLFMVIAGITVQFMRRQSNLVTQESRRMDALQNAAFATTQIERELREAGVGVADIQPMIVQLDTAAFTFNANLVSIDTGDVRAVYQLSDADPRAVRAMYASEALSLPNSVPAKLYPDTTYLAASGVESGAETISYWFRPDSTNPLPNRYVLFRRDNALPPTLVARGIVRDPRDTVPLLTYYKTDTLSRLVPIARTLLPLYHTKIHGSAADTGNMAATDSVRAVRLHFLTAARDPRTGKDGLRTVEVRVRLLNAGLLHFTSCGQPPYAPGLPVATSSAPGAPVLMVTLTWPKSSDDGGGEKDIERYAIFRRLATASAFGDPISSVPATTAANYSFVDTQVDPNATYVYGVAAEDCTPMLSPATSSAPVTTTP
jgi:prepilin-type N-terminal cleavage/methylation domain-containing protein